MPSYAFWQFPTSNFTYLASIEPTKVTFKDLRVLLLGSKIFDIIILMSRSFNWLSTVVLVLTLAIGMIGAYSFLSSRPRETEPPQSPITAMNLPQLYPELRWGSPQKDTFYTNDPEGPEQVEGVKITSDSVYGYDRVHSLWTNVLDYYRKYLEENGWELYLSRFSTQEEIIGWKKEESYFLIAIARNPGGTQGYIKIWHN